MKEIIIKCTFEWCDDDEDVIYVDPISNEKSNLILGYKILDFEKVNSVPENFVPFNSDFNCLYDCEGVGMVYSKFNDYSNLNKHSVESIKILGSDDGNIEYRIFDVDSYSKFFYLFGKNRKIICLTY